MGKALPRIKSFIGLLLCLALVFGLRPVAWAEEAEEPFTVLDTAELQALVEEFFAEERINPDFVSVGFVYTATGEEWYFNPDAWYYSASLYKVPLTMCAANLVARGELEQTAKIGGVPLATCEELILRYSSNDHAHLLMNWFWPKNTECRELWPALAGMENEDFPRSFYWQSYFSAPFITRVFHTLYRAPEDYPNVLDDLLLAQPGEYLRCQLGDSVDIAQKYGSYEGMQHVSGIIYRDNPIIVTLMTQYTTRVSERSGALAALLCAYADTLDERLEARQEEARQRKEAERLRAEEEARRAEEARQREEQALLQAREETAEQSLPPAPEAQRISPAIPAASAAVLLGGTAVFLVRKRKRPATVQDTREEEGR